MTGLPQILRWGPYETLRGWLRGLLVTLAAAAFLALAGAFGSAGAPLGLRFVYWLALMLLGWLWGTFVSRFAFRLRGQTRLWLRVVVSSLVIGIPYSAVVAYAGVVAFKTHYPAAAIPGLVASVVAVTLVMVAINVLIDRQSGQMTLASAEPPKFLERLPLKLRGAEVWAVEAEDHYLRLHTSKGQDLILMRLSDAIAELEGIEGAQVHRSWWVARDAISEVRRGDGRARLTLKDGAEAPVSRSYARVLRERGWI
ncbi:LytTR family DNA-binding domain-containing protein [Phenylobacterium sp.]|jgi:DNA-binding LytR/AlgR family response regulator|uniref:LytTR family DNA-binding domain-containing protein n=1 Tax=Phenylobacterium sp. TaxID=1871053 RepID=UPI002F3F14A7